MKILKYLSEFIFKVRSPGELTPMLAIKAVVITSLYNCLNFTAYFNGYLRTQADSMHLICLYLSSLSTALRSVHIFISAKYDLFIFHFLIIWADSLTNIRSCPLVDINDQWWDNFKLLSREASKNPCSSFITNQMALAGPYAFIHLHVWYV